MDDLERLRTGIARKDPWLDRLRGQRRDGRLRIAWVLVAAVLLAAALIALRPYWDVARGLLASLPAVYWMGSLIVVACLIAPLFTFGRDARQSRRNRRRMLQFEESRYRRL